MFTRRETVQTPRGPRKETLIIGRYVDDLFTLYSHDDKTAFSRFGEEMLGKRLERSRPRGAPQKARPRTAS